jgi:phosphoadenosine phosphosulfate reductase
MWCEKCKRESLGDICEVCASPTVEMPTNVYWCDECKIPIIHKENDRDKYSCPICKSYTKYLCADIRPVFPEERLLLEILDGKPFEYKNCSVWANNNRYYIDGKVKMFSTACYEKVNIDEVCIKLTELKMLNSYKEFNKYIELFSKANKMRLESLKTEAFSFVQEQAAKYPRENVVLSFSGGKDSTVTADLAIKALSDPSLVHIFGDTTLEFPMTIEYAKRYRENNLKAIFKIAKNKEQNFYNVCEDIGPPARMMRWCCSMFKTGPITRVLNSLYRDKPVLTFYGIRKSESVSRSKYNRVEDDPESVKIQKQTVASPIIEWKDIDVWLYLLTEQVDFNDAYRLGYDRVGCWCCPNNNLRAQFLSKIYMPEQSKKWRSFLIEFAKKIGKPDPEVYIDTGKWKARQGGNGIEAAKNVKVKFSNCTAEENAKIYKLIKPIDECFYELFYPFGKVSKELGRKLIHEVLVLDIKNMVPIISIQPFNKEEYEYAVKIKTMNVAKHDDLHRMISYQIKKYNVCRKCLKCESLCRFGAISIIGDEYHISDEKCRRCKMCVTAKYLDYGCLVGKYLRVKD